MATTLPIQYSHLLEGFTKGIDQGGPFYRVIYKILNWQDTDLFCNALMGYARVTGSPGNFTVTRGVPHQHPLSPNLFCISATVIQGLGNPILSPTGYPNYDGGAFIQAEYRTPPFNFGPAGNGYDTNNQIDPGTPLAWCTQSLSHATETFTVDQADKSKPPAKVQIPITILNLTFHKLPYMPTPQIRLLRGRVNSTPFLGAGAGQVLFKGGETERTFNTDGSTVQELKMTFYERDSNFLWNSGPTLANPYTWEPKVDSNGNKPFFVADLNPLLQF
jgi:hypothetical protein